MYSSRNGESLLSRNFVHYFKRITRSRLAYGLTTKVEAARKTRGLRRSLASSRQAPNRNEAIALNGETKIWQGVVAAHRKEAVRHLAAQDGNALSRGALAFPDPAQQAVEVDPLTPCCDKSDDESRAQH